MNEENVKRLLTTHPENTTAHPPGYTVQGMQKTATSVAC
jgi:hypothetical protein